MILSILRLSKKLSPTVGARKLANASEVSGFQQVDPFDFRQILFSSARVAVTAEDRRKRCGAATVLDLAVRLEKDLLRLGEKDV